jgi:hypothetical protein
MQSYIQQYLSDYYYVKTSEVGNDGIYFINDDRRIPTPFNGSKLIKEIVTIFGLKEDEVKSYIESWAVSIKPDIDLEFYWKTMDDLFGFPITHRIAAQTIGMDLVAVQPISGPRVELLYMDFQYGVDTATGDSETVTATTVVGRQGPTNRNGRVYDEEIYTQSWGDIVQLYENQENHIVGELDHPTPSVDITMTDSDDSAVSRAIQKWSSLIGISSRKLGE